jgi:hypothetical protein
VWRAFDLRARPTQLEALRRHEKRTTLRVGDVFVKIDADQTRTDVEEAPRKESMMKTVITRVRLQDGHPTSGS